jgi:PKD repeat protein
MYLDGSILAVIFNDPNQTVYNTVILLFGAQSTGGDTFDVSFYNPIDLDDPDFGIDFSLGISFGYQGGSQYSIVDVNSTRLTTSAGGQDDGYSGDGGLITVGGIGDSITNPPDPYQTPTGSPQYRYDDELYDLVPFVNDGDTSVEIDTVNPSNDDSIFFAALFMRSAIASLGDDFILPPPQAAARVNPSMGQAPHPVQFYDMSTGEIDSWFWEFGDGSFSEAQYPTHTYQNEGTYQACLTVEGPGGTDEVCMQVIVESAAAAPHLVVRNLYISGTQVMPRDKVVITADVFNEGGVWGDGDVDLIINGAYEQSVGVGVAPGTAQPISFTVYKVAAGEYQVVVGNAVGTFYVLEEQQPSQMGGIPMDSGTLIALIMIAVFVIAALVIAIVIIKPS